MASYQGPNLLEWFSKIDGFRDEVSSNKEKFRKFFEAESYKELSADFQKEYGFDRENFTSFLAFMKSQVELEKNDERSMQLLGIGIGKWKKSNDCRAFEWCYRALGFAKTEEKFIFSYMMLADFFIERKNYDLAFKHARTCMKAIPKEHPAYETFFLMAKECIRFLKKEKNTVVFIEKLPLTYNANPRNPEIVGCVRLGENGGLFATRDLKVGDVIATTEAFIAGAVRSLEEFNCGNCWTNIFETAVIPCDNCPITFYCSKECQAEDLECHQLTCGVIHDLYASLTDNEWMAFKFTFKVLSKNVDIRKTDFQNPKVTCVDWNDGSFEDQIKAVCSMKTNIEFDSFEQFTVLNNFFYLLKYLKKSEKFVELLAKFEDGEELFFKTYWKGFQVMRVNSVSKEQNLVRKSKINFDLLFRRFNHSCAPNVVIISNNNINSYIIFKNIKAGEELFISYE